METVEHLLVYDKMSRQTGKPNRLRYYFQIARSFDINTYFDVGDLSGECRCWSILIFFIVRLCTLQLRDERVSSLSRLTCSLRNINISRHRLNGRWINLCLTEESGRLNDASAEFHNRATEKQH